MPVMQLVNGAASTTSVNAQTTTDAVVTPTSVVGFPSAPQFTVLVRETGELLLVTQINVGTPTTWSVTRGFGGSTSAAITGGNHLDYSLTREMLLGGFMAKLDEQVLTADTLNGVVTLTVPSGLSFLRNLKLRIDGSSTTNSYLNWRFNNDSSALYDNTFAYWGSGSSSGQWNSQTYGRVWMGELTLPSVGADVEIEIGGADATDRNKTWLAREFYRSGASEYHMIFGGVWRPAAQAAISTIQVAVDNAQNGVWAAGTLRAGFRASLYGVP